MPRLVYLAGAGAALVALAFLVADGLVWRPGVTLANVRRIRRGMTLQEVKRLLGPHQSDSLPPGVPGQLAPRGMKTVGYVWDGAAGEAIVWVRDGRCLGPAAWVTDPAKRAYPAPTAPSPLDRLRAWLGW